jgi:hypothetical protein
MVTYNMYIQSFLRVDEDNKGLYVEVPGMGGDSFKVHCEENDTCPQVIHCRCSKFAHKGTCEHASAVEMFWSRIYRTNIVKAEEKALEASMNEAESIEEAYELAKIADQVVAAPIIAAPKLVKKGNKLVRKMDGQSARTSAFFSALPSRQKVPAA